MRRKPRRSSAMNKYQPSVLTGLQSAFQIEEKYPILQISCALTMATLQSSSLVDWCVGNYRFNPTQTVFHDTHFFLLVVKTNKPEHSGLNCSVLMRYLLIAQMGGGGSRETSRLCLHPQSQKMMEKWTPRSMNHTQRDSRSWPQDGNNRDGTVALESSGTIFSEFRPPKDIYLLSIQAIYYIKFVEKWHELTKILWNIMKHTTVRGSESWSRDSRQLLFC